jgi:hypothetical protein
MQAGEKELETHFQLLVLFAPHLAASRPQAADITLL